MEEFIFLTLAEIVEIHNDQIQNYGGSFGLRDIGLLESAIAQPSVSFDRQWLHENIFLMASAYAFHICENHPFFDGNKRVALASSLIFLEMNDITILDPKQKLLTAMLSMAKGNLKKPEFAVILESLAK